MRNPTQVMDIAFEERLPPLMLPDPLQLSPEQARTILRKYTAAIEPNFTYWMSAAVISSRSLQGRYAAAENLEIELRDDHRGMLRRFAAQADATPNPTDYRVVQPLVNDLQQLVSALDGAANLTSLAMLETRSRKFIPFLEKLAQTLGARDFTYTQVHGEADIAHARQFIWALKHETSYDQNGREHLANAVKKTNALLEGIFAI